MSISSERQCVALAPLLVFDLACWGILAISLLVLGCTEKSGEAQNPLGRDVLSQDKCVRIELYGPLSWVTSGVWDGESLLLVDVLQEQVLQVSPSGRVDEFEDVLSSDGQDLPGPHSPSQIRGHGGEYYLEDEAPDLIYRLNAAAGATGPTLTLSDPKTVKEDDNPDRSQAAGDLSLRSIYDWSPLGDGFVAYGDLKGEDQYWISAFLFFDSNGRQQIFYRIDLRSRARTHYTLNNLPYIATLGDAAYILFLDETPRIGRVVPGVEGVEELPGFPEEFRVRPELKPNPVWIETRQGARQATHFLRVLEESKLAAGIYAWGSDLYLLAKGPMTTSGKTKWYFIQLDPTSGREVARKSLLLEAAHMTVIPGETWALIEKGRVEGVGESLAPYMKTDSVVLVPNNLLEEPRVENLTLDIEGRL